MAAATIRIFLVDGTPQGPRVIEKSNWTGRGFDFARVDWPSVRSRPDFDRPGMYVLIGVDDNGATVVYLGEADELRKRLNQHFGQKDFWTRAVVFTSKDENLNKAHVRFLESRLISLAAAAKRVTLENGNAPPPPFLSESDQAEVETFLAEMLVIYPLVGVDAFTPPAPPTTKQPVLQLKGRGVQATGQETPDGFVVRMGSGAAGTEVPSIPDYLRKLRRTLVDKDVLLDSGAFFRFAQDFTFNSPSTAGGVVLGRSTNGRDAWRDPSGRTLAQIEAAVSTTS